MAKAPQPAKLKRGLCELVAPSEQPRQQQRASGKENAPPRSEVDSEPSLVQLMPPCKARPHCPRPLSVDLISANLG